MNLIQIEKSMWALVAIYWLISSFFVKKTIERESLVGRTGYVLCLLSAFNLLFEDNIPWKFLYLDFFPQSGLWKLSGVVLCALGLLFALSARWYLGRNWSGTITLKKDHELIQTGPYGITRNPIYTGFVLAFLGCVLSLGQFKGIVGLILLITALFIKINKEEKFMIQAFGERYKIYKSRVPTIFPWLY
jgi:protein-S-isoprenylcysteine O-methyltransferase Ste14